MESSRNFSGNTVGDNAKIVLGNAHVTVNTTALDDDKLFLQEFNQIDPVSNRKNILMRNGPLLRDPCHWILDHKDFNKWRSTEEGVLWIKGDPGKGKTMLLCSIIEELEECGNLENLKNFEEVERIKKGTAKLLEIGTKVEMPPNFEKFEEHRTFEESEESERLERFEKFERSKEFDTRLPSAIPASFFCQAADCRTNNAAAVVRGLIFTMLKPRPALLKRIREKYGDGPKGQFDGDRALVILCDLFENIVRDRKGSHYTCVVDALDECIEDCDHLLGLIIRTSDTVKWLISSRNEKQIERKLAKISKTLELESGQNIERVSASVDMYVDHHIQEITAIQDDEVLQSRTSAILKNKASGTFLWVALVIEQLHNIDHWEVEDALEEMPKGLGSIYDLILGRLDNLRDKPREACRALLSIVAAAKRPLHLMELLIFTNGHWKGDKRFKTTYQLRDIRDMAKSCGSILSIRDDIVYFVHQSAKDYIMEAAAHRLFPIKHQHYKMFEASLDAMSSTLTYDIYKLEDPKIHVDKIPPKDVNSDPLAALKYCCVFWVEHLVKGFEHFADSQKLHSFLVEKFLCWIESLALMRSYILHSLPAIQKLKKLIDNYWEVILLDLRPVNPQMGHLMEFLEDACRFLTHSTTWVHHWPLQLYFLAIEFEPSESLIKKIFHQTVRDRFGPLPAAFHISQSQPSSAPLRTITFPRQQDNATHHHYLTFSPSWHSQRLGIERPIITSWVIKKEFWEFETNVDEDNVTWYCKAIEKCVVDVKPNMGDDSAYSHHFMSISRENVIQDRRARSHFHHQTLNLSQGPYQGLDLRARSTTYSAWQRDRERQKEREKEIGILIETDSETYSETDSESER